MPVVEPRTMIRIERRGAEEGQLRMAGTWVDGSRKARLRLLGGAGWVAASEEGMSTGGELIDYRRGKKG